MYLARTSQGFYHSSVHSSAYILHPAYMEVIRPERRHLLPRRLAGRLPPSTLSALLPASDPPWARDGGPEAPGASFCFCCLLSVHVLDSSDVFRITDNGQRQADGACESSRVTSLNADKLLVGGASDSSQWVILIR